MTDTQVLVISLSIVIPLSMLLYSNSRISDVRDSINNLRDDLKKDIKRVEDNVTNLEKRLGDKIDNAFEHMELLLKLHVAEHHKDK